MRAWIKNNWERCFLFLISLVFLTFSIRFFLKAEITGATAAFVMFFLCLIYANVARFKRFKGLGFEAELWEDKQQEAADLIERLQTIVQVYTREIVMMKVMSGRWDGASKWPERWALYDELVDQHDTLGQDIDFSPLKEKVYRIMVFDAASFQIIKTQKALTKAYEEARKLISREFGNPIKDAEGHSKRMQELNALKVNFSDLFKISETQNVAQHILRDTERSVQELKEKFGVEVELPSDEFENLRWIDKLIQEGELRADPKIMSWADHEK